MLVPRQCAALYDSKHEFVIKYLLFVLFFSTNFVFGEGDSPCIGAIRYLLR